MGYSEELATQYSNKRKNFTAADQQLWTEFKKLKPEDATVLDF